VPPVPSQHAGTAPDGAQSLSPPAPSIPPKSKTNPLDLSVWERFHVRLTLLYGVVILIALGVLAIAFYVGGVNIAMSGIRSRLGGTAVALARGIDAEKLSHLQVAEDGAKPTYKDLVDDAVAVEAAQGDLLGIYVLVPSGEPGMFKFAFDHVATARRSKAPAKVGESYDARSNAQLQRGLNALTVETEVSSDAWGQSLSAYAPVLDRQGKHVALVGVDGDARAISAMKREIFGVSAGMFLITAIVVGIAGSFVGRKVREPLSRIIEAATAISAGNLETRLRLDRPDEFGILGEHFDEMARGLQERERIRSTFGRYVSEDVAKRVLGKGGGRMGGEVREVTVLFSDLKGYSTISETLSPTETVEFLNEYLEVMNAEIDKEGGCIIEFLGDAILAVFGAPAMLEGHPEKAMRCAMAMREALKGFNEKMNAEGRAPWQQKGMSGLGQRIGIHTGNVVAGNLGSKVRVKYAVIGTT
jgi:adenylate cyclase